MALHLARARLRRIGRDPGETVPLLPVRLRSHQRFRDVSRIGRTRVVRLQDAGDERTGFARHHVGIAHHSAPRRRRTLSAVTRLTRTLDCCVTPAICGVRTRLGDVCEDPRRLLGQRLGLEDVERRPGEMPVPQRRRQRRLVDEPAPRRVHQHRAALHAGDRRRVDQPSRLVGQRHVEAEGVALLEKRVQRAPLGQAPGRVVRRQVRIVGGDDHTQRLRPPCRLAGVGAEADEAETGAGDLAPHQAVARPLAGQHGAARMIRPAQQHQDGADDVFRDRRIVRARGRRDGDAARFARRLVDIVEADAEPADDAQGGCGGEEVGVDLRAVAHHERPRDAQLALQARAVVHELRVVEDVLVAAQVVDRRLVHELRDHDVGHHLPRAPAPAAMSRPARIS